MPCSLLVRLAILISSALYVMAYAQVSGAEYPKKPVRVIVPYSPGGPTDVLARVFLKELSESLGAPIVVENKPGASGLIGSDAVAKAAPDGYTLLVNPSIHVINPSVYKKMPYDALRDFAPVSQIADVPLVLVVKNELPVRSVQDLIAYLKASKGPTSFASSGTAAAPHLAGELFKIRTGTQLLHIPYKGSAPALTDLLGGQVDMMIDSLPSSMPFIQSGRLRALAVTTPRRIAALPDVPTMAEAGVSDFHVSTWYGLWAPARTPRAIVEKLAKHIGGALATSSVQVRLASLGALPVGSTPVAFTSFISAESGRWKHVVEAAGIQPE
ncbi:tripartite tricarboxylate transporter substrate binding protein [Acidovorax sp. D2M1]|uniref:Tripartite tricarboxylate transporter substrate binding protein n=1 Tax=Acidovorax benzenivorans TaxID=2987520 RepID=A0ABT5S003_9BURK|nr:tripartite tricarboxylate transporter substrate binding protein [Acidovorax benzenivorans]MDD2179278.1 tripartite tricarboxylate transporter substrate binding protein [Acidovorax benzenivorans]